MAEGSPVVTPEVQKRTDDRYEALADLVLDNLIERAKAKNITAAELTVAFNLLKQTGVKLVIGKGTKATELGRVLPSLPPIEAGERFTRTG